MFATSLLLAGSATTFLPLRVAYSEPAPDRPNLETPVLQDWANPEDRIVFFARFREAGPIHVRLRTPASDAGPEATLRLNVNGQRRVSRTGDFGRFQIRTPGYVRFELAGVRRAGPNFPRIEGFEVTGPPAFIVSNERKNAASVHLGYPTDPAAPIIAFYTEVRAVEDPVWSFYMATGFRRGYFGMQTNNFPERRIIFSVWDAGDIPDDPKKVPLEDRVLLLKKSPETYTDRFGNEGTGGHSHWKFGWKTGQVQRFLLLAKPNGKTTQYQGWFSNADTPWRLIAAFQAPKDGEYLRGLHSFNENFWGLNGQKLRRAKFARQWIRTADQGNQTGSWTELTKARFTHDSHGGVERFDYLARADGNGFWLQNGGFTNDTMTHGTMLERPKSGAVPPDLEPLVQQNWRLLPIPTQE